MFNVVVEDTTLPVIAGCVGSDIIVIADAACEATATWTALTVTDNCGATLTSSHDPGDTFPFGITVVTYTATDAAGNIETCTFNVIVEDQTPPVFSNCILTDIEVFADGSCEATANWIAPAAVDNCGAPIVGNTHSPGDVFPLGTTTVTYTATDASGNSSTCVFDVVVIDNFPPEISGCNTTDILAVATEACAWCQLAPPTATDNLLQHLVSSHDSKDVFFPGPRCDYTATTAEISVYLQRNRYSERPGDLGLHHQ